jgi:ribulose bisphosphate carboxylase small subunit
MTTIDSPQHIPSLAISPQLKTFLEEHLIHTPFEGDPHAAQQFWQSTGTQLHYLTAYNVLADLPSIDKLKRFQLIHLSEMLLNAPEEHVLLLAVTQDDGGGTYLLFPKASRCCALAALGKQAHD